MTSAAQTQANQNNAQFSTGPRTEQGKAVSSMNGTTHGLSSGFSLLPHEDQSDFAAVAERVRIDLQPSCEHETFLVDRMIEARWRIVRVNRLEAVAFDLILDPAPPESPDARIVAHITPKGGDVLSVLQRYSAAAERSYQKNYRELLHGRQVSQRVEQKAINNSIKNAIFAPMPAPPPPIGFASQKAQTAPTTSAAEALGNLALRL